MDVKEAARRAIAEKHGDVQEFERDVRSFWTNYADFEEVIFRAFALAGYGWRPIECMSTESEKKI